MKNKILLLLGTILTSLTFQSGAAPYAIVARDVQLNGYNLSVDSFNSTDPLRSTPNGQYNPATSGGDMAVVASEAGIHNANNVGTVDILGYLETGLPFALDIGDQSRIGSSAWFQSGQPGIEPGHHSTNFVMAFPDVVTPYVGYTPASGTYAGVFYNYILMEDAVYELPSFSMSGGQKMLVVGSVQFNVKGNVNLSGNSHILILPSASLRLYVGGTANLRGNGIINQGPARNFMYLGTGSNHSLDLRVVTPFAGIIYAPYAVCTISGAGNTAADLQGSILAHTIALGSHVNFHFDEGL